MAIEVCITPGPRSRGRAACLHPVLSPPCRLRCSRAQSAVESRGLSSTLADAGRLGGGEEEWRMEREAHTAQLRRRGSDSESQRQPLPEAGTRSPLFMLP
eukprot:3934372-Rhodomonas_salina.6